MAQFLGPLPAGNYMVGRAGHTMRFLGLNDPSFIVIHTMVGTIGSADARFKNPASQVSAHYGVGLNGEVVQWVNESDTAYHAGNWEMNLNSVGIEHEDGGDYNGPRTTALYEASSGLVRELCLRYGIPISRQWVIRHRDVTGVATSCPDALDIDRIVTMAQGSWPPVPAAVAPPLSPPPPAEPPPPVRSAVPPPAVAADTPPPAPPAMPMSPALIAPEPVASPPPTPPAMAPLTDAPPTVPPPATTASSGDPLRDIAASVYGDPARWQEIYDSIKNVASQVPVLVQAASTMTTVPAPSEPPVDAPPIPHDPTGDKPGAPPRAQPPRPAAPANLWGGSQGAIFGVQILYLTILATLAIIYFTDRNLIDLPETLGPISVAVPWFGALGAVLISLVGITQHRRDWDPTYRFWHWSRPLLGASFGSISVLIFQAGILAVGSTPTSGAQNVPRDLLYYLVAFVVGYREETFRELIKRLTDIVFSPGTSPGSGPAISSMTPQSGPAAGGTIVTVLGNSLSKVDSIRFGTTPAKFQLDGDTQITVTSPPGQAGTAVSVSVGVKSTTLGAGTFTYVAGS